MKNVNLKSAWVAIRLAAVAAVPLFVPNSAKAVLTADFSASGTSDGSHVISGTAHLDLSTPGQITLTLTNTSPITYDPGELLTGFSLTLKNGSTTLSISSITSSGVLRTVASNDTYTDGATSSLGWGLQGGNFLRFNGGSSIIGPATGETAAPNSGIYSSAGGGIAGNAGHNPFAGKTATFVLTVPGSLASTTTISDVKFYFGTTYENVETFTPVPEPTSVFIFGLGLGVACLSARAPRRAAKQQI